VDTLKTFIPDNRCFAANSGMKASEPTMPTIILDDFDKSWFLEDNSHPEDIKTV
jgi:hypothetical protein